MGDLRISELLAHAQHALLSFEFFPPKSEAGLASLQRAADQLLLLEPDFVTVTYGAGGSTRGQTLALCERLRAMGFRTVMPHLTCVGHSRGELEAIADEIHARGFRNIMTLRGDPPQGAAAFHPAPDGLRYAAELVGLLKARHPDFCCGVAGYPEKHPEAPSLEADIAQLKAKVEAGADFVTTQLFFDNQYYYEFIVQCREAGIRVPIVPGLMPALSYPQIARITQLCHASFPAPLERKLKAAGEGELAEGIGIHWAVEQIEELLACRVPGLHMYVLNRSRSAFSPGLINCLRCWRA